MKAFFSFSIILLCFVFVTHAQTGDETLFKIDAKEYKVEAFINSFQKNAEIVSASSESIEDHLERFVNFHLKLRSAYEKQMDTLPTFKKEFKSYYKQIADSYISNGEVTEAMVKETYDRTKTEVRAIHILLNLPKHEEDTTEVYQKALMIKTRIDSGEDFESLAKQYSEDPSVQMNAGDMNWFNTFRMVYEFEDATYKLEVDEVSEPVRTDFGYHIIKKTGERPSKGKLETAHIMLFPGDSLQDPELRIQKIYKRLQDGEDFHELAKQYSQDPNTAKDGGYVPAFSLGGLNSKEYENKTYNLENEGDFSEPFKTQFGWHIVKLIKTTPLEAYDEVKEDYKKKLKSSSRSNLLVTKIKENLEKLYKVEIDDDAKSYFLNLIDSMFAKGKWKYEPSEDSTSNYIIQVEENKVDYNAFGEYLEKQQRSFSKLPDHKIVVDKAIDDLVYSELLKHHKTKLPEIDFEFAERVEEFKNGILIFDYMRDNVWEPVSEDTISQKNYYEVNKSDFRIPQKVNGKLYTSKSKKSLKTLASELKSRNNKDTLALVLPENIIVEDVELEAASSKLPKKFKSKEGLSKVYKHSGQFLMIDVLEIEEPKIPEFEKVSGKIISILQEKRERKLISELRDQYDVVVDERVLNKLKAKFEK